MEEDYESTNTGERYTISTIKIDIVTGLSWKILQPARATGTLRKFNNEYKLNLRNIRLPDAMIPPKAAVFSKSEAYEKFIHDFDSVYNICIS